MSRQIEQPSEEQLKAALEQNIAGKRSKPSWNADDVRKRLQGYDRTPFLDVLQHWLESGPTQADVEALAKKAPDKWASAVTQLARIAGYTEKTESTINHNVNVNHMSDAQLEDEIRMRAARLNVVDVPYHELPPPAPAGLSDEHSSAVVEILKNSGDPGDFGSSNQS